MSDFIPVNPMGAFQQGYSLGNVIRQNAAAKAAAEAEAQRKTMQQKYIDKALGPGGTSRDWFQASLYTPEAERESFNKAVETYTTAQKEQMVSDTMSLVSAIDGGYYDVAKDKFTQMSEAARNEGDTEAAKMYDMMASQMDDPQTAKIALGTLIQGASGLPGFDKAIGNVKMYQDALSVEQTREFDMLTTLRELGLSDDEAVQVEDAAYAAGDQFILDMLQYAPLGGGKDSLSESDKLDLTLKLQDRYRKYSDGWREADLMYNKLLASANDDSGQGDLALIFQFMKLLDEGSVVRESEYAQAANTGDLYQQLSNWYARIRNGQKLQPEQRASFAQLAGEYVRGARKQEEKSRNDLNVMISNRGLRPEEILIGAPTDPLLGDDEWEVEQLKRQLKIMNPGKDFAADIDKYDSIEELKTNYPSSIQKLNDVDIMTTGIREM